MRCRIVRFSCRSRWFGPLAVLVLVTGCASVHPPPPPPPVEEAVPPVPVRPALPRAAATHRFTLEAGEDVVGAIEVTMATRDDTLPDIARRFNVGYEEIVRANPDVDPWLPGEGREVVLPTAFVLPDAPREGVVINVAAMRLYYFPKVARGEPQVVITHPIGIGRVGWQTPEGTTRITARVKDPVWTPPLSVRREHHDSGDDLPAKVPAGPDNPLGAHLFRLGWPTYLIHGTNKPYGVGMRSSHGCIRLYPEDIARLFDSVPIGTPVRVVNQPTVLGWRGETLYVQSFGSLEDDHRRSGVRPTPPRDGGRALWSRVRAADARIDWPSVVAEASHPRGLPLAVMKDRPASVASEIASAPRVADALPVGATWDGHGGAEDDEAQYAEMLGARESAAGAVSSPH
jgi:L,D-transpeptidase ErfK/SrfK